MPCIPKRRMHEDEDKKHTKEFQNAKKLLLLGTGESGKTTIIKQMRILHINGFNDHERKSKIENIKQNIHESIYTILNNMTKLDPPEEIKVNETKDSVKFILDLKDREPDFSSEYYEHIKRAWKDPGVQKTFQRSNEYQLIDCAEYFLNKIDEIRQENYLPDDQDILHCRIMTKSISKIEFQMPLPKMYGGGAVTFWMFDVGGQRGERRKWIQVFDGIQAILVLIAASDFDQTLREDNSVNRLTESFNLFESLCDSKYVRQAGLIVFLNKQDVLQKKIELGRRLEDNFPEFKNFVVSKKDGDSNSKYDRARLFMRQKILDIAGKERYVEHVAALTGQNVVEKLPPRAAFVHFTIATDTKNIQKVFESVQQIILEYNIKSAFY